MCCCETNLHKIKKYFKQWNQTKNLIAIDGQSETVNLRTTQEKR